MSDVTLRAETGRQQGSRASRRLRREGKVPATLYGQGSDPLAVSVDAILLRNALSTDAGLNAVLTLEVGKDTHTSLARELQRHPTRGDITHLDFVKISLSDRVDAVISVELLGEPVGVRDEGGIVETVLASVTVNALVTNIPESIEIDIAELSVGDSVKVSDLPEIEGVEILDDPDQTVATVTLPAAAFAEEEEELLEGEEGEEVDGEGEEGAEDGSEDGGDDEKVTREGHRRTP